jgi:iron complex transport system substrate-binding protein
MRIVSLLPSATEILFEIGAGDDVVAVTHECDYPDEARRRPKVTSSVGPQLHDAGAIDRHVRAAMHAGSSLYRLDAELLERLEPDLIVTQELCPVCAVSYDIVEAAGKRLRTDPRIVSLEPSSLEDVLATIIFIGEITGRSESAERVVATLRSRIQALHRTTAARSHRPRTLVLEWTDPPMSAGHWIPGLVELAGGTPILAHPGADSQRLEWRAIAEANPEALIVAPCGFDLGQTKHAIEDLDQIAAWQSLAARRHGKILAMDGNAYVSRPGPRLVESAEIIAQWYTSSAEYAG